jgi:hypothetical protein
MGGLNRIANGNVERINLTDNPSTERVKAILDDREGNLWVGVDGGGLFRLKAGRISHYSAFGAPDDSENVFFVVHRSRDGTLRAGGQAGLLRYENNVFKIEVPSNGRPLGPVWSIAEDRNGTLWLDESIGVGTLGMVSPGADPSPIQVNATSPQKPRTLEEAERAHIVSTLGSCGWKVSGKGGAAEVLGVPESTLRNQMKRLGIARRPRQTTRRNSKT